MPVREVVAGVGVTHVEGPFGHEGGQVAGLAAARGDTNEVKVGRCERVRRVTGSCTLGVGGGAVGGAGSVSGVGATCGGGVGTGIGAAGVSTLGGDATLGCGATLGSGATLGGGTTLGGGATLGGGGVDASGAGSGELFLQLLNRSQSLAMAYRCSWWAIAGASLTAHDMTLSASAILSSGVTSGWVRYSWWTLVVSEMRVALVVASTTLKQR